MVAKGEDLTELPGIGDDLAAKIQEIVATGQCKALEKLRKQVPPSITELLKFPALGRNACARSTTRSRSNPSISSPRRRRPARSASWKVSCENGTDHTRGPRRARHRAETPQARHRWPVCRTAEEIPGESPGCAAGGTGRSYRRFKETVGDIDILVTATGAGR